MISLEQLLESRDRRVTHQRSLVEAHPGRVLLCLTVQLPGSVKRNRTSLAIADAGVEAIQRAFSPEYKELKDLETGYEGYFLLSGDPLEIKRRACQLEDTHPLGRLMDIDVIPGITGDLLPEVPLASAGPAASENYFSGQCPKNQFPEAIANLTHADAFPIGREAIGLAPRCCLLCGLPARVCMRAHTHTQAELLDIIEQMVKSYTNR